MYTYIHIYVYMSTDNVIVFYQFFFCTFLPEINANKRITFLTIKRVSYLTSRLLRSYSS